MVHVAEQAERRAGIDIGAVGVGVAADGDDFDLRRVAAAVGELLLSSVENIRESSPRLRV